MNTLQTSTAATMEIAHQYPLPGGTVHGAVPQSVADAVVEAEKCLAVGAPNACGVMVRRAMHSLCDNKGATGSDLYKQLEQLKNNGIIAKDLWEWAEELRTAGKVGAHPEWEALTPDEADYVMRLLREVIRYVYINPAEREAMKLKETKKKTSDL